MKRKEKYAVLDLLGAVGQNRKGGNAPRMKHFRSLDLTKGIRIEAVKMGVARRDKIV